AAALPPAPLDRVPLAGTEILPRRDLPARALRADLGIAEMEPELPRAGAAECDRHRNGIAARRRFLDEADDLVVIDEGEAQIAGLQQRGVGAPQSVEAPDVVLDVAGPIPIANLELVFLGIEIFLAAGDRGVLDELEPAVDAVARRQRRRPRA